MSLRWQPLPTFLLRGSWGTGFLAPTLYQLCNSTVQSVSAPGLSDPLRCPTTGDSNDCDTQFTTSTGGNPELQPDQVQPDDDRRRVGTGARLVDRPRLVLPDAQGPAHDRRPGGDDTGRPRSIRLSRDPRTGAAGVSDAARPDHVHRPALDQPGRDEDRGHRRRRALQVARDGSRPVQRVGYRDLLHPYEVEQGDGTFVGFVSNAFQAPATGITPRWKSYAALNWTYGPWTATLGNSYQSSYVDVQTDPDGNLRRVGTLSLWDVQTSYTGFRNLTLTLGAKNVFDTNPPLTNQNNTFQVGFDPSYYDARARFIYGSLTYSFK